MSDEFNSEHLDDYIRRWQRGEREAADALLRATGERLKKLVRRMIRSFPNVRPQADSGDVFQSGVVRLLRSLRTMRPASTRDYFNLAAVHIRRELLDLARRCKGRGLLPFDAPGGPPAEPAVELPPDFEFWSRFHLAVDKLPAEEREVVGLAFYHGWTQAQIAKLFGVDERTVRRRWKRACVALRDDLGGPAGGSFG